MMEIGGEFHLPLLQIFNRRLNQFDRFTPNSSQYFLTSSGRDSLRFIIKILALSADDEVLLPAYLPEYILNPFTEEHVKFTFYKINKDLSVDIDDINKRITDKTKALLFIHYFGYPQPITELQKLCREYSLSLIEDAVQSFLTRYEGRFLGCFGDLSFTSFRKFLPVLDGSLLLVNNSSRSNNLRTCKYRHLSLNYLYYIGLRYLAMNLKNLYLKTGLVPKPLFLRLFSSADGMLNKSTKPSSISHLSQCLLKRFDFDDIILKRRRNFQYLLDNWNSNLLQCYFTELPDNVCPLGFPVLAKNRDYVKHELIKRRIYPPVHWNLPSEINEEEFKASWEISRTILTIPIDQRYKIHDMDYILLQLREIEAGY